MPKLTDREHVLRLRIWLIEKLGGEAEELNDKLWVLRRRGQLVPDAKSVYQDYLRSVNVTTVFGSRDLVFTESSVALPKITTKAP